MGKYREKPHNVTSVVEHIYIETNAIKTYLFLSRHSHVYMYDWLG